MNQTDYCRPEASEAWCEPPEVQVVIEVPRGSFLKRGSTGRVDFVSPLPCPFNYGSVPNYLGLEGDLLDALVLGPRLPLGARIGVYVWGAVTLTDRGMTDDKLVCSDHAPDASERLKVLRFFHFYAKCKGLLNVWRGRPGRNACDGWCDALEALARARPRDDAWQGPSVEFCGAPSQRATYMMSGFSMRRKSRAALRRSNVLLDLEREQPVGGGNEKHGFQPVEEGVHPDGVWGTHECHRVRFE